MAGPGSARRADLKRLIELVAEGGGQLSLVLVGHPKLKNDLRRPKMEEIGDRTTVFEFGGLRDRQRNYIDWVLRAYLRLLVRRDDRSRGTGTVTSQQKLLDLLRPYLEEQFGCHTAILYGSRARGDWDIASDIDVMGFRDTGEAEHAAHRWQELHLDLFLYPTATEPDQDWLRIHGGRVLFQRNQVGDKALAAVNSLYMAGPKKLTPSDAETRRLWLQKMLARAEKGDAEGDYRRHWLLMTLLEDYFAFREQWYLGPKRSLTYLERERPAHFALFRDALKPSASLEDIRAAIMMAIEV